MNQKLKQKLERKVTVRFSVDEYKKLDRSFKGTTQQKLSGYVRNVLLQKPVTVYTRSQSMDDFVSEMILLRSELKAIGNNLNQAVKRLHTMQTDSEIKTWALASERSNELLFKKMKEIFSKMIEIENKWSQE